MNRVRFWALGLCLLATTTAHADKLSDFKEAAGKTGCQAMPYNSERRSCEDAQRKKDELCKEFGCSRDKVEKQLEKLKEKRKNLEEAKSRKNEAAIPDLEKAVKELEESLKEAKETATERVRRCENCILARQAVQKVFATVKGMVKGESDEALKPYIEKLVEHYDKGTAEHVKPLEEVKGALENCKWVANITL